MGEAYRLFKSRLTFPPGILCYICAVPLVITPAHHLPIVNPNLCKDGLACLYPDIIKPISFHVYNRHSIRAAVFAKLGLRFDTFDDIYAYQLWLIQRSSPSTLNIHEVVVAYFRLLIEGGSM
jgi:hypothetical protein